MLGTNLSSVYDQGFFAAQGEQSLRSARVVAGAICQLFSPKSVVDVGCGRGGWLRAFTELGVHDICGIDGDYVDRKNLLIPESSFVAENLTKRFDIWKSYDLAMCLEVAEHLPASAGARLVHTLTQAAPLVLFSAAVPGQGGSHHINEQWPGYLFGQEITHRPSDGTCHKYPLAHFLYNSKLPFYCTHLRSVAGDDSG